MTATPWSATIDVSTELATQLIQSQFPSIQLKEIRYLGEGWDNKVFSVNGIYVFRFPRRELGVTLMTHEIRVMPLLEKYIHLPIAHPRFIGHPTDDFPHPFAGYDYLEGEALADLDFAILPETDVLQQLAYFLKDLHAIIPSEIPTEISEDISRMDYEPRVPAITDGITQLEKAGHVVDKERIMDLVKACASVFPAENTCIVHGDLHPRHILIRDNKLAGIIDWGDMSFGCKAMDLSILYTLYPREYHAAFWAIYGEVPEEVKWQALFRAIYSNVLLAMYALDTNYPALLRSSLQGLGNCSNA